MFLFSVIIPTFNNLEYLKHALKSLEQQQFKSFETIIVDDGSTDGTNNFINNLYNKKNINLKYFYLKNSEGPAKPRNIGIQNAEGDWISFLDADDFWLPNKLMIINNYIEIHNIKYQLYYHQEYSFFEDNNKKKIIKQKTYKKDIYYNLLTKGNICSTSATVVNRDFITKNKIYFNEEKRFVSVEDYDFWLKIAYHKGLFKPIKSILGVYRIHKDNLTENILWHKKKYLKLIYYHIFDFQDIYLDKVYLWRKILRMYILEILVIKIFKLKKYCKFKSIFILLIKHPCLIFDYIQRKF